MQQPTQEEMQQQMMQTQGQQVQGQPVGEPMPGEQLPVPVDNNPFEATQYKNVDMPDVPLSYGGSLTESLINDNEVPKAVKQKYWYLFHKDNVLTFLDEPRKASKLLNFDIIKIDMLNAMPYYDYDFKLEQEFSVMRNVFETKLDRAMGFKGAAVKNERIILQSQFSEQRHINEDGSAGAIKEGFFKRLLGRR